MGKGAAVVKKMNIPVGISDFEKIRKNGYYYVDKSGLIAELLREESTEVTLITRPRRFGKTLGMSMLNSFFSMEKDSGELFDGLAIMQEKNALRKMDESVADGVPVSEASRWT